MSAPIAKAGLRPGVKVTIGGTLYDAPPLTFGAIRQMRSLHKISEPESFADDLFAFVMLKSLSRNYDGIDAAWLNTNLEGSEIAPAVVAMGEIMNASGLKKDETVEAPPEGKPQAG